MQLRAWLARRELPDGGRPPPERERRDLLGVSRGELRKALARLEAEGEPWRHIGIAERDPDGVFRAMHLHLKSIEAKHAPHAQKDRLTEASSRRRPARGAGSWRPSANDAWRIAGIAIRFDSRTSVRDVRAVRQVRSCDHRTRRLARRPKPLQPGPSRYAAGS